MKKQPDYQIVPATCRDGGYHVKYRGKTIRQDQKPLPLLFTTLTQAQTYISSRKEQINESSRQT
jgi:hypothetical protein